MKTKLLFKIFVILLSFSAYSAQVNYKTFFGNCPSRAAGKITLKLIKIFEKERSLKEIKERIVKGKLAKKYFISDYKITFDPMANMLRFNYTCPQALMKVQIYKEDGPEGYDAILVENGELYDPTYEVILKAEKKLKTKLPFLAIPVGQLEKEMRVRITEMMKKMDKLLSEKVSEVILNEDKELTVILSVNNRPSSVFLGEDNWTGKIGKLTKIVSYMQLKKRIPVVINLTNLEKVVVKFNDKF